MYTIGNLQAEDIIYYIIVSPHNMVCVTTLPCNIPLQISYSVHMCQKMWKLVGSGGWVDKNIAQYTGLLFSPLIQIMHSTQKLWHQFLAQFLTTLRHDRQYLWKATIYRPSEKWIANYGYSHTWVLNLVNFGLQSAKKWDRFNPPKINCFGCLHLGHLRAMCPKKFHKWYRTIKPC